MFVEIALRLITTARLSGASSCKIKNCGGGGRGALFRIDIQVIEKTKYLSSQNLFELWGVSMGRLGGCYIYVIVQSSHHKRKQNTQHMF